MEIRIDKLRSIHIWKSKIKTTFVAWDYWFLRLPFGIVIHYAKLPF